MRLLATTLSELRQIKNLRIGFLIMKIGSLAVILWPSISVLSLLNISEGIIVA